MPQTPAALKDDDTRIGEGGELHQLAGGTHPAMTNNQGLVIGDDDGLLCVPFDAVEAVHAAATQKAAAEARQMANIEAGTHDASWVDATLRRLGCEGLA